MRRGKSHTSVSSLAVVKVTAAASTAPSTSIVVSHVIDASSEV
jgi:hypothetical protein